MREQNLPGAEQLAAGLAASALLSGIGAETLSVVSVERRRMVARVGAALLHVRWFVRAPVWLYRARLGVVFGSPLLMIEHTGRTSGLRRYVVLEIVDRPSRAATS